MEFGLISSSGKLPEVAQDALGGFSRIDDDESFQMFDRSRAFGLFCSGMDVVSAGYCCERGVPGCCHGVAPVGVLQRAAFSAMVRLYCWPPQTVVSDQYKCTIAGFKAFQ